MLLNVLAAVSVAFISPVLAEGTLSPSSTSTSAPGATHTVSVGADGFNFSPNQVFADVGDIIEYRFYPQNHSVARAAFGQDPCIPYEDTGAGRVGFWSGFRPLAVVLSNPPTYSVRINDTDPVFFYCSAPGACFEGMVGVINPNSTFTFEAQFNYTQNATEEFSPMEYFPKEVAPTRTTTATGATATPTAVTSSPAATTTGPALAVTSSKKSSGISTGAIVGIAIGAVAVIVLAGALFYMCGRQKTVKELLMRQSHPPPSNPQTYQPSSPGMSEANYASMQKSPFAGTHYSAQSYGGPPGTETESYRSISPPPPNEHTHMMGGMHPSQFHQNASGAPSLVGSPGFPSPAYSHEMSQEGVARPYNPEEHHPSHLDPNQNQDSGPHELAVPSRNASTAVGPPTPQNPGDHRPFSYSETPIENRAIETRGSEKNDSVLR